MVQFVSKPFNLLAPRVGFFWRKHSRTGSDKRPGMRARVRRHCSHCIGRTRNERIARTASATRVSHEYSSGDEFVDVSQRRIFRAFSDLRSFGRRELFFQPVHNPVDHQPLTRIELIAAMCFPKFRLL